jgi:hypothetical protein
MSVSRGGVMDEKLIVANCSGFYGDRFSAAKEMVEGGPLDVLTGDYLAELTMAILFRKTLKNPEHGFADTFLRQMEQIMGACLSRNIKVVTNAGGLSPRGLAEALKEVAGRLGLTPRIAWIDGDNLMPRMDGLMEQGERFTHMDTGKDLDRGFIVTSNAYLGGWGITRALQAGADIVVGGRIADASLVSGPAAWRFGWSDNDWDKLAGAVAAGHVIECGAQATGGNYAFMDDILSFRNVGFPIAEIYPDGSSVITKHPGTGGRVTCGTVTSQLLYEVRGPEYLTPDVTARFDTLKLDKDGPDRIRITGTKGLPPTDTLKVCINRLDGHRNTVRVILTGLDTERKAEIVESMLFDALGGKDRFEDTDVRFHGRGVKDPQCLEDAHSFLKISVKGKDADLIGKRFPQACIELALCSIPGFTLEDLPGKGAPVIQHWPALIPKSLVETRVTMEDVETVIPWVAGGDRVAMDPVKTPAYRKNGTAGETIRLPLGRILGARSGDKGGNANLGIWAKKSAAKGFLYSTLTPEWLKALMPDLKPYPIERHEFPNLNAVNFYIRGILGDGVASSLKPDPQAKTLGEYFRAKKADIPLSIVDGVWNDTE